MRRWWKARWRRRCWPRPARRWSRSWRRRRRPGVPASSEQVVTLPVALHARPAGALARVALRYESRITLVAGEKAVDAKSILKLLTLGATAGTSVRVTAEGADAEAALAAVVGCLLDAE